MEVAFEANGDLDATLNTAYPNTGRTVANEIAEHVSVIGENMNFRRAASLQVKQGVVASYVHNAVVADMGRIGVLVALESAADQSKLQTLGKQIAMHIAASNPSYLEKSDVTEHTLTVEKDAVLENAGKFIQKFNDFWGIHHFWRETLILPKGNCIGRNSNHFCYLWL